MLRGKRAVITGGGAGFGQALSVWLAREGVEVDFCARRADDGVRLENGKYPTLSLFFVQTAVH